MGRLAEAEARAAEIKAWRTTGEAVQVGGGSMGRCRGKVTGAGEWYRRRDVGP